MKRRLFLKRIFLLSILASTCFNSGFTQPSFSFRQNAFTTLSKTAWHDSVYLLPQFREGAITLEGGFTPTSKVKLNYNLYFERMEIITEKDDTVPLSNYHSIQAIVIGKKIFHNDKKKGYVEILTDGPLALVAKHTFKVMFETSRGELFAATSDYRETTSRYDRIYTKADAYFFIDKNNQLHNADKPSVLKLFPEHKEEIKNYLEENPVSFKRRSDLIRLLDFCSRL